MLIDHGPVDLPSWPVAAGSSAGSLAYSLMVCPLNHYVSEGGLVVYGRGCLSTTTCSCLHPGVDPKSNLSSSVIAKSLLSLSPLPALWWIFADSPLLILLLDSPRP